MASSKITQCKTHAWNSSWPRSTHKAAKHQVLRSSIHLNTTEEEDSCLRGPSSGDIIHKHRHTPPRRHLSSTTLICLIHNTTGGRPAELGLNKWKPRAALATELNSNMTTQFKKILDTKSIQYSKIANKFMKYTIMSLLLTLKLKYVIVSYKQPTIIFCMRICIHTYTHTHSFVWFLFLLKKKQRCVHDDKAAWWPKVCM